MSIFREILDSEYDPVLQKYFGKIRNWYFWNFTLSYKKTWYQGYIVQLIPNIVNYLYTKIDSFREKNTFIPI